ncbi:hypothetical protein HMPREF0185_02831 [Brevundimonas diminuta 470-4]|nr:hypothetical protein HMPREF0185_02831 [Brevundimonas diminuta 470-4]
MGVGPATNPVGAEVFSLAQEAVLRWRPRNCKETFRNPFFDVVAPAIS